MPASDHPDAPPPGAVSGAQFDPQGFVRVEVDDPTPFVGQQATLRAWVYLPSTEAACDAQHEPQLTGFWNESLIERGQTRCARQWFPQVVGGRQMFAGLLRKVAIFPTRAGRLEVGSIEVIGEYIEGDGFFGQRRQINVRSPAVVVEAREPALDARPPGYVPGLIGPLQIVAELDRTTVATGETATLRVRATGNGYLGAAGLPPPPTVEGVRMHPGSSRNEVDKSDERNVRGTLFNEYLLVPERPGAHALGVLHVPWFSPLEQRFHHATVVLPTLTATGAAQPREQETHREDPTLALDPYEPEPSLTPYRALISTAARAWMTLLVFPVVLAGWGLARALRRLGAARRLAADDVARNDPDVLMARATERLTAGDAAAAVDLAARALDRALKSPRTVSDDLRARIDETRSVCDTLRFSGVGDAHVIIERVRDTLRALDQEP
jgi:hypothetical protein